MIRSICCPFYQRLLVLPSFRPGFFAHTHCLRSDNFCYDQLLISFRPGILVRVLDAQHRRRGRCKGPPTECPPPWEIPSREANRIADPHPLLTAQRQQHAACVEYMRHRIQDARNLRGRKSVEIISISTVQPAFAIGYRQGFRHRSCWQT